jgi:hypothetical protein
LAALCLSDRRLWHKPLHRAQVRQQLQRQRKARAEKATATEAPKSIPECNLMLNDIGGAMQGAKLTSTELADLRVKGATMSSLCEQSKFKEAFDTHNQIISTIKSHKNK